jgi:hypothetical protein
LDPSGRGRRAEGSPAARVIHADRWWGSRFNSAAELASVISNKIAAVDVIVASGSRDKSTIPAERAHYNGPRNLSRRPHLADPSSSS